METKGTSSKFKQNPSGFTVNLKKKDETFEARCLAPLKKIISQTKYIANNNQYVGEDEKKAANYNIMFNLAHIFENLHSIYDYFKCKLEIKSKIQAYTFVLDTCFLSDEKEAENIELIYKLGDKPHEYSLTQLQETDSNTLKNHIICIDNSVNKPIINTEIIVKIFNIISSRDYELIDYFGLDDIFSSFPWKVFKEVRHLFSHSIHAIDENILQELKNITGMLEDFEKISRNIEHKEKGEALEAYSSDTLGFDIPHTQKLLDEKKARKKNKNLLDSKESRMNVRCEALRLIQEKIRELTVFIELYKKYANDKNKKIIYLNACKVIIILIGAIFKDKLQQWIKNINSNPNVNEETKINFSYNCKAGIDINDLIKSKNDLIHQNFGQFNEHSIISTCEAILELQFSKNIQYYLDYQEYYLNFETQPVVDKNPSKIVPPVQPVQTVIKCVNREELTTPLDDKCIVISYRKKKLVENLNPSPITNPQEEEVINMEDGNSRKRQNSPAEENEETKKAKTTKTSCKEEEKTPRNPNNDKDGPGDSSKKQTSSFSFTLMGSNTNKKGKGASQHLSSNEKKI